jgi:hypothetical protein
VSGKVCGSASSTVLARSDFTAAVRASLLPLSAWLCRLSSGERAEEAGRVLQVMREVGSLERSGGDYSTHCQVLANLLSTFFSCVACSCICESAVEVELVLSHCTKLLVRWVGPASKHSSKDALKIFVLTSLLKRAMSQVESDETYSPLLAMALFAGWRGVC